MTDRFTVFLEMILCGSAKLLQYVKSEYFSHNTVSVVIAPKNLWNGYTGTDIWLAGFRFIKIKAKQEMQYKKSMI